MIDDTMKEVTITISEETKKIIETYYGGTVEAFLEDAKNNLLENQQGNIPVVDAARMMNKSQQFVRVGIQRGTLPIGHAIQISSDRYTYYISPKLFYEYTGIDVQNKTMGIK
ncbi:MAG: hypothetical protein VB120_03805 [Lachnospiraceae bacterium]|nr:hypothetical protein [Lachnospiraceae bacterium]